MKKSLFAIAAATAFTGAAHAQSSVTVYGILDVGYASQTEKVAGTPGTTGATTASAYGATTTSTSGFSSSAQSTSRLGFRGNEDLGGGMSAFFTFETTLNPTGSNTLTAWNNRQAFVGLGQKGMGNARIGTQYTPVHESAGATDAGQLNNLPGNVVYGIDQSVNGQNQSSAGQYPAGNPMLVYNTSGAAFIGGPSGASPGWTHRSNNMIRLESETLAGFKGKLFYVQGNSATNQTSTVTSGVTTNGGGVTNSTGWGAGLDYTWQKLLVTAAYQNFKQQTGALNVQNSTGDVTSGFMAVAGTSNTGGVNANDNQMYFGATYDFGILKAYAQYINRKVSATYNNNLYVQRTAQQIGVRSNVTKTIEAFASVGTGKVTNSYDVGTTGNSVSTQSVGAPFSGYQLGSNYWLSKRTNLYAIYGITQTGNAVYPSTANGSTTSINANSSSISAYALGIRHTF
jgi:predicted porin